MLSDETCFDERPKNIAVLSTIEFETGFGDIKRSILFAIPIVHPYYSSVDLY